MNIVRQIVLSVISMVCLSACSLEPEGLRTVRAHSFNYKGIAHAYPAAAAPRYCQHCHGSRLQGGERSEPSCFRCHGERWAAIDPEQSRAPDDHEILQGIFRHRGGYEDPLTNCSSCHGAALQGSLSDGTPSCYLCHEQLWDSL